MNTNDVYWLAGILEGEGCFFIRKLRKYRYPTIGVTMTDEDIVRRLQEITGIGTVCMPTHNPKWKQQWRWQVAKSDEAIKLMKLILPFMGNRRTEKIKEILKEFKHSSLV